MYQQQPTPADSVRTQQSNWSEFFKVGKANQNMPSPRRRFFPAKEFYALKRHPKKTERFLLETGALHVGSLKSSLHDTSDEGRESYFDAGKTYNTSYFHPSSKSSPSSASTGISPTDSVGGYSAGGNSYSSSAASYEEQIKPGIHRVMKYLRPPKDSLEEKTYIGGQIKTMNPEEGGNQLFRKRIREDFEKYERVRRYSFSNASGSYLSGSVASNSSTDGVSPGDSNFPESSGAMQQRMLFAKMKGSLYALIIAMLFDY